MCSSASVSEAEDHRPRRATNGEKWSSVEAPKRALSEDKPARINDASSKPTISKVVLCETKMRCGRIGSGDASCLCSLASAP